MTQHRSHDNVAPPLEFIPSACARRPAARDCVRLTALLLTYIGTITWQTRSLIRLMAPRDLACAHAASLACPGELFSHPLITLKGLSM